MASILAHSVQRCGWQCKLHGLRTQVTQGNRADQLVVKCDQQGAAVGILLAAYQTYICARQRYFVLERNLSIWHQPPVCRNAEEHSCRVKRTDQTCLLKSQLTECYNRLVFPH